MTINWKRVIKQDQELRTAVDHASEALARLRWENTLGAIPLVSFAEYGRQVGVTRGVVARYANAWTMFASGGPGAQISISDALVRADMTIERHEVVEAIAEAKGVTEKTVRAHGTDEVRRVESIARERATAKGTSVREEAATIAHRFAAAEKAEKTARSKRADNVDLRWLELEKFLKEADRALSSALRLESIDFSDEHRTLISESIAKIKALLGLVEARWVDVVDVDWDAELVRLNRKG